MKSMATWILVCCAGACSSATGQSGIITTVAGNGINGFSGDGGTRDCGRVEPAGGRCGCQRKCLRGGLREPQSPESVSYRRHYHGSRQRDVRSIR